MTHPVTISTATQGSGTAATKAQSNGKDSGFLGMMMAAIGHKSKTNGSEQTASTSAASAQAAGAANATGVQIKHVHIEAHALLHYTVGNIDPSKIKGHEMKWVLVKRTQQGAVYQAVPVTTTKAATGQIKTAALVAATTTAESKAATQAAKAKTAQEQAAALADAAAKAAADHGQQATDKGDGAQKGKAGHSAMAKHSHHSSDDASGTANPAAAAIPQIAAATATPQPTGHGGTRAAADAPDTQAQAQGRASAPMDGSAGKAAQAASMRTKPGTKDASVMTATRSAPGTSPEKATDEAAMTAQATPASGQAKPAATQKAQETSDTAQATAAGMQAEARHNGKDAAQAKASQANAMASAAKAAKSLDAGTHTVASHPRDTAVANSHAGDSAAATDPGSRASQAQTGIQSYGQVAGQAARPLPAQATLVAHADRPASPRTDATTTGPTSIAGQDPTGGNMAWAGSAGIGQSAQTAANPQPAMAQAPVHTSGPWTAMAAMTEIGQAAANGHTRLELKLEPAHLGKVHVRIDSDSHKNIQVHLVVEQAASRQAIEQQLPNLRHALEQQGLNLGNFSMSSQQQGGGQGSGQPAQPQVTLSSAPEIRGTQTTAPQITNTPGEVSTAGRLSIRI